MRANDVAKAFQRFVKWSLILAVLLAVVTVWLPHEWLARVFFIVWWLVFLDFLVFLARPDLLPSGAESSRWQYTKDRASRLLLIVVTFPLFALPLPEPLIAMRLFLGGSASEKFFRSKDRLPLNTILTFVAIFAAVVVQFSVLLPRTSAVKWTIVSYVVLTGLLVALLRKTPALCWTTLGVAVAIYFLFVAIVPKFANAPVADRAASVALLGNADRVDNPGDLSATAPEEVSDARSHGSVEACFRRPNRYREQSEMDTVACVERVALALDGFETIGPSAKPRDGKTTALAEFVQLSDAQIRDERMFDSSLATDFTDLLVGVTERRPYAAALDGLVFDSFVAAFAQQSGLLGGDSPPGMSREAFLIHTGDLLDVSVVTELERALSSLEQLRELTGSLEGRIFSVGGNHDGLTYGNFADWQSDTSNLGINQSEFVAGHLLMARGFEHAYGFEANELLARLADLPTPDGCVDALFADVDRLLKLHNETQPKPRLAREDLEEWCTDLWRIGDFWRSGTRIFADPESYAKLPPLRQKQGVRVQHIATLRLGYYSFTRRNPAARALERLKIDPDVKFLVLDTRGEEDDKGSIDPLQLGWLYDELESSLASRQPVVVFAHHGPGMFAERLGSLGKEPVIELVRAFPNVVGYFYGHGHHNKSDCESRPPTIQTGSIIDYPQVARHVRIGVAPERSPVEDTLDVEIEWSFLRPKTSESDHGETLRPLLRSAFKDSEKEAFFTTYMQIAWFLSGGFWKADKAAWEDDQRRRLRPGKCFTTLRFETPEGSSELDDLLGGRQAHPVAAFRGATRLGPGPT